MEQRYFTAAHNNSDVLKKSSSGGIFTAVTDEWFSEYGEKAVVYGCVMDEDLKAKHIRATDSGGRDRMCGSKYVSSDVSGVFNKVLSDLKSEKYVVFSGTPCQIAGLKSYLKALNFTANECLLTIEVVCHGVGSNSFFSDYISRLEKKYKSKAVSCNFRAKSRPGKTEDMQVVFANGKKYNASSTRYDWFYSAYIKNYLLRPSCFSCKFAKPERISDICISDNWKEFSSANKHLSTVITCSEMGCKWFLKSAKNLSYTEKTLDDVYQPNLHEPSGKPQNYDEFWSIYDTENGYLKTQRFIGNHTVKGHIRSLLIDILNYFNLIDAIKTVKSKIKRLVRR